MNLIGNTPLHIAAENKNFELIKILLNLETIDFKKKNKEDKTPMNIIK